MADTAKPNPNSVVTLLLTGDVMTGRGTDQILMHPGDPRLHEGYATSALDYVALAERAHGPIPRQVPVNYIWGDALAEIDRRRPDLALINLETAITARGAPEPKGINYRMHPANTGVLAAARIGACTLANNHILDWGQQGLLDTLELVARSRRRCGWCWTQPHGSGGAACNSFARRRPHHRACIRLQGQRHSSALASAAEQTRT